MQSSPVWESEYMEAYDRVLLNADIYLAVRDFHLNSMGGCATVLDSGAGTGNVTVELLKMGKVVYAVDSSSWALDILKKKCQGYGERLCVFNASAERPPFDDGTFDGITSMFVAHFLDDVEGYLREHHRVLAENGVLALTGRVSGEHMERVVNSYEESLRRRGLLPALARELGIMRTGIMSGVSRAVRHNYTATEMAKLLESAGFRLIEERPNPYFGQCYSFVARK